MFVRHVWHTVDRTNKPWWGDQVSGYSGYYYYICRRGKIESKKGKYHQSFGTWMFESQRGLLTLYVTCPSCSSPNDTDHDISRFGRIYYPCIVCARCGAHFFPELEGWDPEYRSKLGKKMKEIPK